MNGSLTRRPRTTVRTPHAIATTASTTATSVGSEAAGVGLRSAAEQRQGPERADEQPGEQDRADEVDPARSPGRLPAAARRPRDDEGDDPDRDVDVEHPAPGGGEDRGRERAGLDAQPRQRRDRVDGPEDRGAQERPRGHAEERERADDAEGARARRAAEQVRGGGGRDRDQRPAADGLDQAGRDQELERRRHPREQAADREHDQRPQEQPTRAVQVRHAPGQRHRDDRDQEIAVDDPGRLAQARPAGEVGDDRRQRDGRDHELEAGEEHAGAEQGEEHVRLAAREGRLGLHARECRRDQVSGVPSAPALRYAPPMSAWFATISCQTG